MRVAVTKTSDSGYKEIREYKDLEECVDTLLQEDFDGFKYLEGKPVSLLNQTALVGTANAHIEGEVPQILFSIPDRSEHSLGELFYFFEFACGVSAYLEGVNPFNQPGVESYKKNIKELLSKYKD